MFDPIFFKDLEDAIALEDSHLLAVEQENAGGIRKQKKLTFEALRLKLAEVLVFLSGIKLSSARTAFQELTSGTLSTSGWYTIAECDIVPNRGISADINIAWLSGAGSLSAHVNYMNSSISKVNGSNTTLNILGQASNSASLGDAINGINSIRIAKSDTVNTAGAKIQIRVIGVGVLPTINLSNNVSRDNEGFFLVTPYLDDEAVNPGGQVTLPDGVTVATFIEAGAERLISGSTVNFSSDIMVHKVDDNQCIVVAPWHEIPKRGSIVTINYSGANVFIRGGGQTVLLDSSFTEGIPTYNKYVVSFSLTKIGGFINLPLDTALYLTAGVTASASIILS